MPLLFTKGHFHWKILKSMGNCWKGHQGQDQGQQRPWPPRPASSSRPDIFHNIFWFCFFLTGVVGWTARNSVPCWKGKATVIFQRAHWVVLKLFKGTKAKTRDNRGLMFPLNSWSFFFFQVLWVEQQETLFHVKRDAKAVPHDATGSDYVPPFNDPKFPQQWYLVSHLLMCSSYH